MKAFWLEIKKQLKVMDVVIIVFLFIASFIPYAVFAATQSSEQASNPNEKIAIVSINGKEVDRFVLNEETPHQLKTFYPGKDQYNIIEVDGQRIRVKEDNSPDQVAVKTGWISRAGQTSLCLPHKLMIEIKNSGPTDEEDLIISY